jgi:hypothetical protein
MTRLIREPLVHFILLAILIFGGYQLVTSNRQTAERTIVITQADIDRLASLYAIEAGSLPTDQDMRAILTDQIQQEALAREATRLGMAEDDTVVQRRLAQKMTFMLSDLGEVEPPAETVLQTWLQDHAERFQQPLRLSFDHVFFSDAGDSRVPSVLAALNAGSQTDWRGQGDPFMLQRRYAELPLREIVRLFGGQFASELSQLPQSNNDPWQGPITSALGTHLVRITQRTEARMPSLEEVRPAVLQDWTDHEQRRRTADEIAAIVDQYEIVIEGADGN